ncbi:uncharacterized protein LOC132263710 [Phlebotomus argentipes]|uniref:uncharacterized protein LOC132263710 n=1 Tax=Phlebotomus argentipes TaxID=94469 RepID=UPI0028932C1E|nr:uncharacterized protein LOC132263710 [Phlebotomus argentipes]
MSASIGVNLRVTGHCSQGGRKYMEDFFSVAYQQSEDEKDLEYAFFGIYDGHGGCEAATYAKEHLMNEIVNQKLFWSENDSDILKAIREGYHATHNKMWREQEKWPKTPTGLPSTAGTTASVAFIRHGKIYIGHVGDSGIVLGYQDENNPQWKARQLTQEHKPESNVEKTRIMNSGGKVVTKSGVPRVVWTRPRLGHKGPVRRSTPIDEIPFLAVARSLGDLWSYNSELNEFVVSPDPDVRVISIDPKKFRCLIFGTDGLWNVLSASAAVETVHGAEVINERNMFANAPKNWINPSKYLVDKALERWSNTKMRADNTSVVTIMLDPPGPPKRDLIRSTCPSGAHILDHVLYIQNAGEKSMLGRCQGDMEGSAVPPVLAQMRPPDPYAPSTSFDVQHGLHGSNPTSPTSSGSSYMSSGFVESYNSLLEDHETPYHHEAYTDVLQTPLELLQHQQSTSQYVVAACEETYSLTKLETRTEQLSAMAAAFSGDARENHLMEIDSFHDYAGFGASTSQASAHEISHQTLTHAGSGPTTEEILAYCRRMTDRNAQMDTVERYYATSASSPGNPGTSETAADIQVMNIVGVPLSLDDSVQIHEISSSNLAPCDSIGSPKAGVSGQATGQSHQMEEEFKGCGKKDDCDMTMHDEGVDAANVPRRTLRRPQRPSARQGVVTRSQDAKTLVGKVRQKENTKARSEVRFCRNLTLRSGKILHAGVGGRLRNVHTRATNRLRILAVH